LAEMLAVRGWMKAKEGLARMGAAGSMRCWR
jgi:hypothetical protein